MNLIQAPARMRIHPFPWSEAPPGKPHPATRAAQEHRMLGTYHTHTHTRGHFNIIRYKAIIQAISLSLMICQHSLSVLFPKQILSCIANFLFILDIHKKSHFLKILIRLISHVSQGTADRKSENKFAKSRERVRPMNDGSAQIFRLRVKKLEF